MRVDDRNVTEAKLLSSRPSQRLPIRILHRDGRSHQAPLPAPAPPFRWAELCLISPTGNYVGRYLPVMRPAKFACTAAYNLGRRST
jgi:hypothetical protein